MCPVPVLKQPRSWGPSTETDNWFHVSGLVFCCWPIHGMFNNTAAAAVVGAGMAGWGLSNTSLWPQQIKWRVRGSGEKKKKRKTSKQRKTPAHGNPPSPQTWRVSRDKMLTQIPKRDFSHLRFLHSPMTRPKRASLKSNQLCKANVMVDGAGGW